MDKHFRERATALLVRLLAAQGVKDIKHLDCLALGTRRGEPWTADIFETPWIPGFALALRLHCGSREELDWIASPSESSIEEAFRALLQRLRKRGLDA